MLNCRPVELRGLFVLLRDFVVSALRGGKGTGLALQAPC